MARPGWTWSATALSWLRFLLSLRRKRNWVARRGPGRPCRAPEVHRGVGAPRAGLTEIGGQHGFPRGRSERPDAVADRGIVGQEHVRGSDDPHRDVSHRPRPDAGKRQELGLQPADIIAVAKVQV